MSPLVDINEAVSSVEYTGTNKEEVLELVVRCVAAATQFHEEEVRAHMLELLERELAFEDELGNMSLRRIRAGDVAFDMKWGVYWRAGKEVSV
jgi:hypothetical protein